EPTRHTFRIVLGLNDQKPADWSGQLSVSGGEVVLLRGWRFEEKDAVNDKTGWTCKTHEHVAGRWRYPTAPARGKPNAPPERPWPNGVFFTVRGNSPAVTVKLPRGEVQFAAAELLLAEPRTF